MNGFLPQELPSLAVARGGHRKEGLDLIPQRHEYLAKLTQALLRTSEAERELVLYTARCIEQLVHWNFEGVGDLP